MYFRMNDVDDRMWLTVLPSLPISPHICSTLFRSPVARRRDGFSRKAVHVLPHCDRIAAPRLVVIMLFTERRINGLIGLTGSYFLMSST